MKTRICSILLIVALLLCTAPGVQAAAEETKEFFFFTGGDGTALMADTGSFARRVVAFDPGNPWTNRVTAQDPSRAMGLPDGKDYCMGASGALVLEFGEGFTDAPGVDLYVFELGDEPERTRVDVSADLRTWYLAGVAGEDGGIDLAEGQAPTDVEFRYVRLTDLLDHPEGEWPGADIDAVAVRVRLADWSEAVSAWAAPEIQKAEDLGLFPDALRAADLTQGITRAEFAAVAVQVYAALTGQSQLPTPEATPFSDCADEAVLQAYGIGVVNGVSATRFAPNALLEREQCAVMLTRVYKKAVFDHWTLAEDEKYALNFRMPDLYSDDGDISPWARESVYFMTSQGIINGVGEGRFAPRNVTAEQVAAGYAYATREQALAIAVRMLEHLG